MPLLTRRRFLAAGLVAGTGVAGATLPPLRLLDAVMPTDPGVVLAARSVPYGPGARQRLDVFAPSRPPEEPLPVVVFFHGGSWANGDEADYGFVGRAFAARGFVAVLPGYRLVPEGRFPGFVEDGAAALGRVREIIAGYGGDPDRLFLAGHSAGAYIAAMLALDRRFIAAAGVPEAALRGCAGLAGPYDFLPLAVPASQNAFGHVDDLAATQPVSFARPDAPPFFLGTGDADDIVRPRNTASLARALQDAGGRVEAASYAGIGHVGLLLALAPPLRWRVPVLDDMVRFFAAVA